MAWLQVPKGRMLSSATVCSQHTRHLLVSVAPRVTLWPAYHGHYGCTAQSRIRRDLATLTRAPFSWSAVGISTGSTSTLRAATTRWSKTTSASSSSVCSSTTTSSHPRTFPLLSRLAPCSVQRATLRTSASSSSRQTNRPDAQATPLNTTTSQRLRERVKSRLPPLTPHENVYTVPNVLTFSRLLAAPAVGYLILHDHRAWAVGLFAYAAITDLVDGWIARRWHLQTVVGSVVDPMADKLLMTILVASLAAKGDLPLWLAGLIFGRDASLAIAAIYYRWASLPHPKTLARYWDFSLPSAEVHPTTVSKYNTFLQLILLGTTSALPLLTLHGGTVLPDLDYQGMVTVLQYVVAATTIWSGASYAFLKNAVKILGKDEELKARQGRRGRNIIGVTFAVVMAISAALAVKQKRFQQEVDIESIAD